MAEQEREQTVADVPAPPKKGALARCCGGLATILIRPTLQPNDTLKDRQLKEITVPMTVALFATLFVLFLLYAPWTELNDLAMVSGLVSFGLGYALLVLGVTIKVTSCVVMVGVFVCIVLLDWYAVISLSLRVSALMVPVIDFCLVANFDDIPVNEVAVGSSLLWIVFTFLDNSAVGGRWLLAAGGYHKVPLTCDCVDPPCAEEFQTACAYIFTVSVILLVDFHITRRFAVNMRKQMALVRSSIDTAERVAVALSKYEVDDADAIVAGCAEKDLPGDLRNAFETLLGNLRQYKPYLPDAVLCQNSDEDEGEEETGDNDASGMESSSAAMSSSLGNRQSTARRLSFVSDLSHSANRPRNHPVSLRQEPRMRRVALAACNCTGYTMQLGHGEAKRTWLTDFTRDYVSQFLGAAHSHKGVLDLISADHAFAHFNASRPCALFREAALRCVFTVVQDSAVGLPVTGAACSGEALCGDFGADSTMRYMTLGRVSGRLLMYERLSAELGGVVIDSAVKSDVCDQWQCRLRAFVDDPKAGSNSAHQVTGTRRAAGEHDEWMYELLSISTDPWDQFNEALALYFDGDNLAANEKLSALCKDPDSEVQVKEAARGLLTAGAAAPRNGLVQCKLLVY
eukprot:TRINITY_DN27870_c0_g1_i2.p1 TRINITY_DN27870_c0_g1~~TRINITY_DN27870_c0_g1_i2.p1  ORF type:complete len:669 (+),score=183.20 TRINITY_DN27870_c0_g1_i2:127-2007(+)